MRSAEKLKSIGVEIEIWSITSFNELARGGMIADGEKMKAQNDTQSYVEKSFSKEMPTVAVSEYQKLYSEHIRKWINGNYICLGTDGFGRSDTRERLRAFFEIDSDHIAYNVLIACNLKKEAKEFKKENNLKLNKLNPYQR